MKRLILLITVLCPAIALAGGPTWKAEIISFERISDTKAVLKLKSVATINNVFQACIPLTVIAEYKGEPWYSFSKTWSEDVTKEDHAKALDMLAVFFDKKEKITFGYIGTGLLPESKRNICTVYLRGLLYEPSTGFVAFHDPV